MIHNKTNRRDAVPSVGYLSPLAVWALAFGSAVGWGAFMMPGTTFLPVAGPWGAVLGLLISAMLMLIIGLNYRFMMTRYPDAGGSYTYAVKVLGSDHGYLCAWMLLLTYASIIWANSTALSVIARYLFGDALCFGFTYEVAGYTVYFGEVLISSSLVAIVCLICVLGKRLAAIVQIVGALLLFLGITTCFVAIAIHRGGLTGIAPAFSADGDPVVQVFSIVILAPWAFIGFESISHSAGEFRFSPKKNLPIIVAALLTGALSYIMLTLCASMVVPDGYDNWSQYIGSLNDLAGIEGMPTFHAAQQALGTTGLAILGVSAFCGILTGLIGNLIALSRLIYRLASDGIMPKGLKKLNRRGIPARAVITICLFSLLIPLLGRTAIGWIVDVTTIGATIVYAYVSICALICGRRENRRVAVISGVFGTLIAVFFALCYIILNVSAQSELASESYLILILWSIIGMIVFRALMGLDKTSSFGKSTVVWIILFCLIIMVSLSWVSRAVSDRADEAADQMRTEHTEHAQRAGLEADDDSVLDTNRELTESFEKYAGFVRRDFFIFSGVIVISLSVVYGIFTVINKREQISDAERLVAEESSRAKSAFLSNMSHDIRTPMNAITGYTALALKEEELSDTVREYLCKIDTSGKHLLSLINDILDMSRIENGKMELDPAPADLCGLLDEVYHIFDIQMEQKQLKFTVDYADVRDRYVVCDRNRLLRILLNLISNAYKFTPAGGSVSVVLREESAAANEGSYELIVSDTGIGMSPEFAEHIFDEFEREHSRTVDEIQGTGLGMAITKNLTELMGGTIRVQTEKDKGTTFFVRLRFPLSSEEAVRALIDTSKSDREELGGLRILLAEDNPINTEIAMAVLTQEGFTADHAENGKIAVEMIRDADAGYYGAVLMDIRMPEMNGYEAARAIRALDGERSRVPIIAVSANTFEADRKEAFDSGMNAHVDKPLDPEELVAVLTACIRTHRGEGAGGQE